MSDLTGIPDLLPDTNMFGGGTQNRHGQELDAHIDFNYDPQTKLHRRLNLLVYLNKEWDESSGGSIELHSNPRKPDENQIASFTPLLNRAVVFETNEYSWHGFPRINLPADKRVLSRGAIGLSLHQNSAETRNRPRTRDFLRSAPVAVAHPAGTRDHDSGCRTAKKLAGPA